MIERGNGGDVDGGQPVGAEDVTDKDRLNFCDWYKPSEKAFDADRKADEDQARASLDALFDD